MEVRIRHGDAHRLLYREIRGSVLLTIGESLMVNFDNICLNNRSHYSLDVIEFQSRVV